LLRARFHSLNDGFTHWLRNKTLAGSTIVHSRLEHSLWDPLLFAPVLYRENTLAQIGIIRGTGMTVGPLRPELKLPMIATRDIGEAAATALVNLDFRQKQTRELLGQRDISMSEVVQIIGKNIGKPDLRYTQAPNEQVRPALIHLGMSPNVANLLLEMSAALNSGYMRALEPRSQQKTTPTSYETFVAEEFVPLYEGKSAAALRVPTAKMSLQPACWGLRHAEVTA
jgi:hypothetical protein